MFRRLLALLFLSGMMVLVLFQQPAFAYCAHQQQFYIDKCGCDPQIENHCSHCQPEPPADPCDDCSEKLHLDVDELLWSALALNPPPFAHAVIVDHPKNSSAPSAPSTPSRTPIRPSPPPQTVSLLILHSVFQI